LSIEAVRVKYQSPSAESLSFGRASRLAFLTWKMPVSYWHGSAKVIELMYKRQNF